jgi:hypothetical protein
MIDNVIEKNMMDVGAAYFTASFLTLHGTQFSSVSKEKSENNSCYIQPTA